MFAVDNSQVKILMVDDTPENLEIVGCILESLQYDLYIADNGETATELASEILFDLVLLDIMMPGIDGFETFRRIKRNPAYEDIPVIFLSAKVDVDSINQGYEFGANDYIRKPFNATELIIKVKNLVDLKKAKDEINSRDLKKQILSEKLSEYNALIEDILLQCAQNEKRLPERMEALKTIQNICQ